MEECKQLSQQPDDATMTSSEETVNGPSTNDIEVNDNQRRNGIGQYSKSIHFDLRSTEEGESSECRTNSTQSHIIEFQNLWKKVPQYLIFYIFSLKI